MKENVFSQQSNEEENSIPISTGYFNDNFPVISSSPEQYDTESPTGQAQALGARSPIDNGVDNVNYETKNPKTEEEEKTDDYYKLLRNFLPKDTQDRQINQIRELRDIRTGFAGSIERLRRMTGHVVNFADDYLRAGARGGFHLGSSVGIETLRLLENVAGTIRQGVTKEDYEIGVVSKYLSKEADNFQEVLRNHIFMGVYEPNDLIAGDDMPEPERFEPSEYEIKDGRVVQTKEHALGVGSQLVLEKLEELGNEEIEKVEKLMLAGRYGDALELLDEDHVEKIHNSLKRYTAYWGQDTDFSQEVAENVAFLYRKELNRLAKQDGRVEGATRLALGTGAVMTTIGFSIKAMPAFLKAAPSDPRYVKFLKNATITLPDNYIIGNARAFADDMDEDGNPKSVQDMLAQSFYNFGRTSTYTTAAQAVFGVVGMGAEKVSYLFEDARKLDATLRPLMQRFVKEAKKGAKASGETLNSLWDTITRSAGKVKWADNLSENLAKEGKKLFPTSEAFSQFVNDFYGVKSLDDLTKWDMFGVATVLHDIKKNPDKYVDIRKHYKNLADRDNIGSYFDWLKAIEDPSKLKKTDIFKVAEEQNRISERLYAVEKGEVEGVVGLLNVFSDAHTPVVKSILEEGFKKNKFVSFLETLQNYVKTGDIRLKEMDELYGSNLHEAWHTARFYLGQMGKRVHDGFDEAVKLKDGSIKNIHVPSKQELRELYRDLSNSEMNKLYEVLSNVQDKATKVIGDSEFVGKDLINKWIGEVKITGVEDPEKIKRLAYKTREIFDDLHTYYLREDSSKYRAGYLPKIYKSDLKDVETLWKNFQSNPERFFEHVRGDIEHGEAIEDIATLIDSYIYAGEYAATGVRGKAAFAEEVNYLKNIAKTQGNVSKDGVITFEPARFVEELSVETFGSVNSSLSYSKLGSEMIINALGKIAPENERIIRRTLAGKGLDDLTVQFNFLQFMGGRGVFGARNLGQSSLTVSKLDWDGFEGGHRLSLKDWNNNGEAFIKIFSETGEISNPAQLATIQESAHKSELGRNTFEKLMDLGGDFKDYYGHNDSVWGVVKTSIEDLVRGGPLNKLIFSPLTLSDLKNRSVAYGGSSVKLAKHSKKFRLGEMSKEEFLQNTGLDSSNGLIKNKVVRLVEENKVGMYKDEAGKRFSLKKVIEDNMDVNKLTVDKNSAEFVMGRDVSFSTQWLYNSGNMGYLGMREGGPLNKGKGLSGSLVRTLYTPFHSWPYYAMNSLWEMSKHAPENSHRIARTVLGLQLYGSYANQAVEANAHEWYNPHGMVSTMLEPAPTYTFLKGLVLTTSSSASELMGWTEMSGLTKKKVAEATYQTLNGILSEDRFLLRTARGLFKTVAGGAGGMSTTMGWWDPDIELTFDDMADGIQDIFGMELNKKNLRKITNKMTNAVYEFQRNLHEQAIETQMLEEGRHHEDVEAGLRHLNK